VPWLRWSNGMTQSMDRLIRLTGACLLVAANARAQSSFAVLKDFDSPLSQTHGGILRTADGTIYGSTINGGLNQLGGIFRVQADGSGFTVLHSFDFFDGYWPFGELMLGADGLLYGTTQSGGGGVYGTIFKLHTDGSGFSVIHAFNTVTGSYPYGGLTQGADGTIYGTTSQGGSQGKGTIFRVQPNGSGFTILRSFGGLNGDSPRATLTLMAGKLYGATYQGGVSNLGTVFALATDGSGFTTLHSFSAAEGTNPNSPLAVGADGALYGTAFQGGGSGLGTVFKIQTDGSGFTVLTSLTAAIGYAAGGVIQGLDGALYGEGQFCCGGGTVYRVQTDGSNLTLLHSLVPLEGSGLITPLAQAGDGTLFGFTQIGGASNDGAIFRLAPDGSDFATLHSLGDESGDGVTLAGPMAVGSNGRLFGATGRGGAAGAGTVFGLDQDGSGFSVLHSLDPAQGKGAAGGPIEGLDGALYGTTSRGGVFDAGTVFRLQADGSAYTVLHSFNGGDGNQPNAGLTQGPDGTLYGTSLSGGVFKLQPDGSGLTPLGGLGFLNFSPVALGTDGMLYAATSQGGANGAGLLFRVTTDGNDLTELHSFSGTDGTSPNAVVMGRDGRLYGTTRFGGVGNQGSVFSMSPDGTGFVTLRLLSGLDGANPWALFELPDGRLFGTTAGGGAHGLGTVFMMRPDGSNFEVLHAFGGLDGDRPSGPLVADSSGTLYGTTDRGGPRGGGVVFKLVPPPPPPLVIGPADAWIGLKNSDDTGTTFDLLAEVFQDTVLVASGQLSGVPGVGSGFNNARLRTIALTPATVTPGTTLSIRLSVRVAAESRHRTGTARLWFNDASANSRLEVTIGGSALNYYLLDGFNLGTEVGPGPKKTKDVLVDRARDGNAFKAFGTWSVFQ
jgi:uncharacterized repeat protein (TIGR03803 family)